MKVFDPDAYQNVAVDYIQCQQISQVSDEVLKKSSWVMYGKYQNKRYFDFSSDQKKGDTHIALFFTSKKLEPA